MKYEAHCLFIERVFFYTRSMNAFLNLEEIKERFRV